MHNKKRLFSFFKSALIKTIKKIIVVALLLAIVACFTQSDDVTISKSGKIELESIVEISENETFRAIAKEIDYKTIGLEDEGWKVSYTWLSKSMPYKVKFNISNTVQNLYSLQQVQKSQGVNSPSGVKISAGNSNNYLITFDVVEYGTSRTIKLSSKSLPVYRFNESNGRIAFKKLESGVQYSLFLNE